MKLTNRRFLCAVFAVRGVLYARHNYIYDLNINKSINYILIHSFISENNEELKLKNISYLVFRDLFDKSKYNNH